MHPQRSLALETVDDGRLEFMIIAGQVPSEVEHCLASIVKRTIDFPRLVKGQQSVNRPDDFVRVSTAGEVNPSFGEQLSRRSCFTV